MKVAAAVLLLLVGVWQVGEGAWIHAKAWLAEELIARAWSRTLEGDANVKPWPWADTWPVARLTVPKLGIERYVLEGAHGQALAFGPGHAAQTALPGEDGNSMIGGHRDTHLAFLGELDPGDEIRVERADGRTVSYRVRETYVLHRSELWIASQEGPSRLTLVTCHPLDAWRAGGDERYAVVAFLSVDQAVPKRSAARARARAASVSRSRG
jgi:sortase A